MRRLDDAILSAHASDDRRALVGLYARAAEGLNDLDAACFFLTHAYVFALETGAPEAGQLHARLVAQGREA